MKKILFLALVICSLSFTSKAQNATLMPLVQGDTAVNAGTVSKIISATGGYSGVAIQAKDTKISGTLAGTIQIMGSLDGVNYELIGSAFTVTDVATQTKTFYISAPLPPFIKVLQTGSGTMSAQLRVYYVFRRYQSQ